ncbi:MAG: UDP-N-acetylmuramoyl-L-alanine--D-glutamate ligase [Eubacteriales bacterium]
MNLSIHDMLRSRLSGRRCAVLGVGISNTPLIDFLLELGATVCAYDQKTREALDDLPAKLEGKGVTLTLGPAAFEEISADVIFKSPGIRPDVAGIVRAVEQGAELTSEMQLFFEYCPCHTIAITGSDGKTTTTTLISKILEADGKRVFLGGNIGAPLLPRIYEMTPEDYAVAELSSFQLQVMTRSPEVAVITNITPNHLNWHIDMEEYIEAKANILRFQKEGSRAVLSYDNDVTRSLAPRVIGDVTFVSTACKPDVPSAAYEENGIVYLDGKRIMERSAILLPGRHNLENYLSATAALKGLVSPASIEKVARTFGGVEHRCELVRTLHGVRYYNSSIDSSPTRTMAALSNFPEKVIAICGGYDKHIPYEPLGTPLCERAKVVLLTGATAQKIKAAVLASPAYAPDHPALVDCADLADAVEKAHAIATEGDVVLLSPASASFDSFKNFEERGKFFKAKVNELK